MRHVQGDVPRVARRWCFRLCAGFLKVAVPSNTTRFSAAVIHRKRRGGPGRVGSERALDHREAL